MQDSHEPRLLLRRRDAAHSLSVSEAQLIKWERQGIIGPVRIPGLRAVRYRAGDVQALAENISQGRLSTDPVAS